MSTRVLALHLQRTSRLRVSRCAGPFSSQWRPSKAHGLERGLAKHAYVCPFSESRAPTHRLSLAGFGGMVPHRPSSAIGALFGENGASALNGCAGRFGEPAL
eukprot:10458863-Alexandrium_andersonii.AAC.1